METSCSQSSVRCQVVGQALSAAGHTKRDNVHVHSLHCYFVSPGDPNVPIIYHVERVRDGKSFCTRSVTALQKGKAILTMMVSYQKTEYMPIENQFIMPEAPPPEKLMNIENLLRSFLRLVIKIFSIYFNLCCFHFFFNK